jgi:hypothetical protein
MTEPDDLSQQAARQAMIREAGRLAWLISIGELSSSIGTPILLALILWRVW